MKGVATTVELVLVRLRGMGGNGGKPVFVVERESTWYGAVSVIRSGGKECTEVFMVELGGARIRDEGGSNMSDAIIPAVKHRIPSELRS